MATRRKSSPYAMSASLGSGVRTTTGGSYTNPRFGIEDYTAFGRGVASTFRVPEQEEEQKVAELELPTIDYVGAQKDAMLGDSQWMENSNLVSQLTSDLQPLKLQYEKCTKANDQQCLKNIGTTLNVIQTGQAQFQNMLTKYADSEIMDPETSRGQYMIGTDKKNIRRPDGSFLSLADITKVNNESPKDITMGVVDGKAVYKVKLDGTSYNVNLSDLTENYLTNSFDIRSDIGLDVQTAMRSGGFTSDWEDKPTMYSSQTSETTEDGVSIKTLKGYEGIVSGTGYFENANSKSKTFSNNLYKTISSPNVNSAFNKLTAKIYDGFNSSDEYNSDILAIKSRSKSLNSFRTQMAQIPNDIKLKMLQDEAEQEWLIANASNGHKRGDDGRAERLDKNYLIKTSTTTKPITEDEGSGFNPVTYSDDFYSSLNRAIVDDVKGKLRPGQQQPFEDFLQTYNVPVETISDIQYIPSKTGGPDAGLGILTVDWAREGFDEDGKKVVGAKSTPYDLKTKDGIRKLVNHMSAFSPSLKGSGQGDKSRRQTLIDEFDRVKDIIKFGAIDEFKNTNPVVQN